MANKNDPLISVIVPVYKVEKYIERCVRSLLSQSLDNIEYIFIDDASPDKSVDIIERCLLLFPNRYGNVKIIRREKNHGLTSARNLGLLKATGKYIYHCDSDDCLAVNMLEKLYRLASENDYDIVWSDFYFDYGSKIIPQLSSDVKHDKVKMLKEYISYGWTVVWNMICKRSIYIDNNIRSNEKLTFCEDYELTVRLLALANSWGKVPEPLYYYNRTNAQSIINTSLLKDRFQQTVTSEVMACISVDSFFRKVGLYDSLIKELSWRHLKAKRGFLYPYIEKDKFNSLWQDAYTYVSENPFCSKLDNVYLFLAQYKLGFLLIRIGNFCRKILKQ